MILREKEKMKRFENCFFSGEKIVMFTQDSQLSKIDVSYHNTRKKTFKKGRTFLGKIIYKK